MSCEGSRELRELKAAVRKFLERSQREVDMNEYRTIIDALKHELALSMARAEETETEK
jgi:hypothetical protein